MWRAATLRHRANARPDTLFNRLAAHAEFVGNVAAGHAAQPVHQEDAPGLPRQGTERLPIGAPQFFSLELPLLLGQRGSVCLVQRIEDSAPLLLA